jgi:hypothetical protein
MPYNPNDTRCAMCKYIQKRNNKDYCIRNNEYTSIHNSPCNYYKYYKDFEKIINKQL